MIGTNDLEKAKKFYDSVLGALGIPPAIMEIADRVMHGATPGLRSPKSVRGGDAPPVITRVSVTDVVRETVSNAITISNAPGAGRLAVICPDDMVDAIAAEFDARGISYGRAQAAGLDNDISIVPATGQGARDRREPGGGAVAHRGTRPAGSASSVRGSHPFHPVADRGTRA